MGPGEGPRHSLRPSTPPTPRRAEPRGDVNREPCVHSVHGQRGRPRARLRRPVRSAAEGVPRPRLRHQLHPGRRSALSRGRGWLVVVGGAPSEGKG